MRSNRGFTLIEISISVFILILLLLLAVPSLNGVLADRRLRRSLDTFNRLVQQAQQLSLTERRPYLLVWERDAIILRPETYGEKEDKEPTKVLSLGKGAAFTLKLPAALSKKPAPEWIFWPSGNCEPAVIGYHGPDGSWKARYSPLTARSELAQYAAK